MFGPEPRLPSLQNISIIFSNFLVCSHLTPFSEKTADFCCCLNLTGEDSCSDRGRPWPCCRSSRRTVWGSASPGPDLRGRGPGPRPRRCSAPRPVRGSAASPWRGRRSRTGSHDSDIVPRRSQLCSYPEPELVLRYHSVLVLIKHTLTFTVSTITLGFDINL